MVGKTLFACFISLRKIEKQEKYLCTVKNIKFYINYENLAFFTVLLRKSQNFSKLTLK